MFHPSGLVEPFKVEGLKDEEGNILDVARHPKQIVKMKVPFPVEPYAMLRKR